MDIAILTYICPTGFSFIGKEELTKVPAIGIFFRTIDIAVKRESKISSFKAYQRSNELLKNGKSVVIFPEGGIDDQFPPKLQDFKSGAFRLAIENNVPIVPIIIQNAWEILFDDGKKRGSRPGIVHIDILDPIDTRQYAEQDFDDVEKLVFEKMKESWSI